MSQTVIHPPIKPAGLERLYLRTVTPFDQAFLQEMTYEAVRANVTKCAPREILALIPDFRRYYENWDEDSGDEGLIALSGFRLGAAWYRNYKDKVLWRHEGVPVPEVSMALVPDQTSKGLGSILLANLIDVAREQEVKALGLQVSKENRIAKRLYRKHGFKIVDKVADKDSPGETWGHVMVADLTV